MEDGEWEWEWEWGESKCKASESNARYRRGFKLVYLCFMCAPAAASRWRFTAAALPSNYLHARILFFGLPAPESRPGIGVSFACQELHTPAKTEASPAAVFFVSVGFGWLSLAAKSSGTIGISLALALPFPLFRFPYFYLN